MPPKRKRNFQGKHGKAKKHRSCCTIHAVKIKSQVAGGKTNQNNENMMHCTLQKLQKNTNVKTDHCTHDDANEINEALTTTFFTQRHCSIFEPWVETIAMYKMPIFLGMLTCLARYSQHSVFAPVLWISTVLLAINICLRLDLKNAEACDNLYRKNDNVDDEFVIGNSRASLKPFTAFIFVSVVLQLGAAAIYPSLFALPLLLAMVGCTIMGTLRHHLVEFSDQRRACRLFGWAWVAMGIFPHFSSIFSCPPHTNVDRVCVAMLMITWMLLFAFLNLSGVPSHCRIVALLVHGSNLYCMQNGWTMADHVSSGTALVGVMLLGALIGRVWMQHTKFALSVDEKHHSARVQPCKMPAVYDLEQRRYPLQCRSKPEEQPDPFWWVSPHPGVTADVLVVDDVKMNRMMIIFSAKKFGLTIHEAADGTEALKRLRNNTYSMVFMDRQMPVMNGDVAMEKARADGYTLPIVMVSGDTFDEFEEEDILDRGMTAFLSKMAVPGASHAMKKLKDMKTSCENP